jgi:hypothetical protein
LSPLGKHFSILPRCLLAGVGSSASIRLPQPGGHLLGHWPVSLHYISNLLQLAHLPTLVLSLTRFLVRLSHFIGELRSQSSARIVNNGFTSTSEGGQHWGPLEVPRSIYSHVHVPVPIWGRFWYHWWSSGNEGILAGMFLQSHLILSSANCFQVFGAPDPASPTGWNISPGRQQLISSLMILGAFVASSAAGMPCNEGSTHWSL